MCMAYYIRPVVPRSCKNIMQVLKIILYILCSNEHIIGNCHQFSPVLC